MALKSQKSEIGKETQSYLIKEHYEKLFENRKFKSIGKLIYILFTDVVRI